MARPTFDSVDAYIEALPENTRVLVERARATVRKALPRSTESISYGIPTVKLDETMVLFFAGFPRHWSIYPLTPGLLRELKTEIAPRVSGKTIRFALDEPFPTALVTRIAKVRAAEVADQRLAKAKRTTKKKTAKKPSQPRKRAARSKR